MVGQIVKYPSAWLPVALALAVMALWVLQIAMHGPPARQADEGIAAHLFQIWLALEGVMIAAFAVRWLPRSLPSALPVLAVQLAAVAAACAPVLYFNL